MAVDAVYFGMTLPIRVSDVMSRPARTVSPTATVADAAAACHDGDVGSLVVTEDDEPMGIVTREDLLAHLGSADEPHRDEVRTVASTSVERIEPGEPVDEAIDRMDERDRTQLAVVEDGAVVGTIGADDVARFVPQLVHRHRLEREPHDPPRYRIYQDTAYEANDWEFESVCVTDDSLGVGDRVTFTKRVTEADVRTFAAISGDTNRVHLDEEYAANTRFGRRIVHGALFNGLISAALARLPGVTIYVSQDLTFRAPVELGQQLTAVCEVVASLDRNKFELTTDIVNAAGNTILEGQTAVLADPSPESASVTFTPLDAE